MNKTWIFRIIAVLWLFLNQACERKQADNKTRQVDSDVSLPLKAISCFRKGRAFECEGDFYSAVEQYRQALRLQPNWQSARDALDGCLREAYPVDWSKRHPLDWGAWMTAFKYLLDHADFEEATAHIDRLPSTVTNRQTYSNILDVRRRRFEEATSHER